MSNSPPRSPCVALCKLDHNEICMGCYRSIDEIIGWKDCTEQQQQQIIERVFIQRQLAEKNNDY